MAQENTFDVVSKVDLQEVQNAVQQASKEIVTRFDFRGSKSKIEWNEKELALTLTSDDDHKLKSVVDILETKLVKRGVAVKSLDFQKVEPAAGQRVAHILEVRHRRREIGPALEPRLDGVLVGGCNVEQMVGQQ